MSIEILKWISSNIIIVGGLYGHDVTKTFADTGYTSTPTDLIIIWDTSGGNCVQNLPDINTVRGQILFIRKNTTDANTLTIDANGAQTIDGALTFVLPGGSRGTAMIYATDTTSNWVVL